MRGELSEPVAICALKRAAVDHAGEPIWKSRLEVGAATGKRVGIIGAGPAGLTAAWFLRLKGHEVVLFDSQSAPGGWLRDGIPRYRLSAAALDADVGEILELGVALRMGVEVGKDVAFETVREDHDAVFIAAGARSARQLGLEGAELPGVESGLALLQQYAASSNTGDSRFAGEMVVVIGGGDVAMDVARTALRLDALEVHVYSLEARHEMPAHEREAAEAEREGVTLCPGWGPVRIVGATRVERVDFQSCISVFDEDGRFAPRLDPRDCLAQDADRVLVAIGQEPSLDFLAGLEEIERDEAGNIKVRGSSLETSMAGVFAGGDVVSGPASVVEAVSQGRLAASGIDRYLGGDGDIYFRLLDETEPETGLDVVEGFFGLERAPVAHLSVSEGLSGFSVLEAGYPRAAAIREGPSAVCAAISGCSFARSRLRPSPGWHSLRRTSPRCPCRRECISCWVTTRSCTP